VRDADSVLAPAGSHRISPAATNIPATISDFNGDLTSAMSTGKDVEVGYNSKTRAIAVLTSQVKSVLVDGEEFPHDPAARSILLPAGQHLVSLLQ
jgi:hypothetical protein